MERNLFQLFQKQNEEKDNALSKEGETTDEEEVLYNFPLGDTPPSDLGSEEEYVLTEHGPVV